MAKDFRHPDRDQSFLIPPDMRDWLASDHLVWWLIDVVDALDVSAFEATSRLGGAGRAPYAPRTLLAILIYGYAHEQRSSRQLERLCSVDVGFRILAGNASGSDAPDHSTLARFRQRHDVALKELFTQVLVLCARAGLGKLGMIAIDGTKIAANAAKASNATQSRLREKFTAEIERILAEADAVDAEEDEQYGQARGDELPPSWSGRTGRRERLRAALDDIKAQQARDAAQAAAAREPDAEQRQRAAEWERRQSDPNVTPAERAKAGRPGKGVDRIAMAQVALDRQLQLARAREQARQDQVAAAAAQGRTLAGRKPIPAEQQAVVRKAQARLDALRRAAQTSSPLMAPSPTPAGVGKELIRSITDPDSRLMKTQGGWVQGYNCQLAVADDQLIVAVRATQDHCDTDQLIPLMTAAQHAADLIITHRPTPSRAGTDAGPETLGTIVADAGYLSIDNLTAPGPDRLIALGKGHALYQQANDTPTESDPPADAGPIEQMAHRLRTPAGIALYKRRGVTVEPVNSHIKDRIGLRTFARRGLAAVDGELHLAATVANLLKLHRSQATPA